MDEMLGYFYEDAIDQMSIMENALLDAKDGTNDKAIIGEIFRAMHTIKGSAGMFGFDDIVSLTHKAETLLDEVREGRVILDARLCALFIKVKDATSALVEHHVNDAPLDGEIQNSLSILEKSLIEFKNGSESEIIEQQVETINVSKPIVKTYSKLWHISLRLAPEFLQSGMDMLSILKFFLKSGEILLSIPIIDKIPDIFEIDPTQAYLGFEIDFQTTNTKDDIIEIFEFVEDDIDLIVFEHDDKDAFELMLQQREENLKDILFNNMSYHEESFSTPNVQEVVIVEEPIIQEKVVEPKKEEKFTEPIQSVQNPHESKNQDNFFLRVNSKKVDELINKVSEMVVRNAQLIKLSENTDNEELEEITQSMSLLVDEMRDSIMNVRMVQVKDSFIKYKRIVSDTAEKLGKDINFIIEGEDTELDKSVVEKLSDPLTHMIRNSVDHGIESKEERISKGKNPKGQIILRAYPDSGMIVIEIEDDGKGIDKEAILKKAISNNMISETDKLSEKEIFNLIFMPGFSTAQSVTNISGRGVGMDVVRNNIESLRGTIEINSKKDIGSKIVIRLPLTLAIIDGFLVQAGHVQYIIPMDMISQCIEYNDEYIGDIKDSQTINFMGESLPLLNVRQFYKDKITSDELENDDYRENIVIVKFANYKVGLLVGELYGQQQTVVKPLGSMFKNVPGISGGSVLGSGEIALILDIPKLVEYKINN